MNKLYGFIYHNGNGSIELHINNYPYHVFYGYTLKQAQQRYRQLFNLKYKRIIWL